MNSMGKPQQQMQTSPETPAVQEQSRSEPMPDCCCFSTQTALIIWLVVVLFWNFYSIVRSVHGHELVFTISPIVSILLTVFGIYAIHTLDVSKMKAYFWICLVTLLIGTIGQLVLINLPFYSESVCGRIHDISKTIDCNELIQTAKSYFYIGTALSLLISGLIFYKLLELIRWTQLTQSNQPSTA